MSLTKSYFFTILKKIFFFGVLLNTVSCVSQPNTKTWNTYSFVPAEKNPIIYPDMVGLEGKLGENINGASVIKVPKWIANPLGAYYMYFAHHHGKYIRLAYANHPLGPWTIYKPGALHLDKTVAVGHIASPDVIVDEASKSIRMYFHGPTPNKGGQKTFVSISEDGLNFTASNTVLGPSYFRNFTYKGIHYALVSGTFYRTSDPFSAFEKGIEILPKIRHSAVTLSGDELVILYSQKGDAPERILKVVVALSEGTWKNWKASAPKEVLKPTLSYEGADLPIKKSVNGFAKNRVHELRDPAILIDNAEVYLYYSVAGESGIAVAQAVEDSK